MFQADHANYEPPKKMSAAEQALDDLAKNARNLYADNTIDAEQLLKAVASNYKEEFMAIYRETDTPFRDESDHFNLDPDQQSEPSSDEDDEGGEGGEARRARYTPIGVPREDVDDRRIALERDPDLEEHQDDRFNWVDSGWHLADPEPRTQKEKTGILPFEDISQVATNGCPHCKAPLTMAVTLKCSHMLCIACYEKKDLKDCPRCHVKKVFAATSNCGCLIHLRKDDATLNERAFSSTEERVRASNTTIEDFSQEEIDRDTNAIDDSLRANGIQNPFTNRAILRSEARTRQRQADAQALANYLAEGPQVRPDEVCFSSYFAACCSRFHFINT